MRFKLFKPFAAAGFLLLVCLHPTSALEAASDALVQWALAVAPALLPFLAAAPALTTPEACAFLSRLTGGFLRFMRLPSDSTGALLIGLLSGSPAGAAALSSMLRKSSDPPGSILRASLMASGASPAFLLTGIAVGMLNAPDTGWLLLRSQLLAVLLTGLLLRSVGTERPVLLSSPAAARPSGMLAVMQTLLTVGGYMAFFSVLSRQLSLLLGSSFETPLLAVLELAGGCRALSVLPAPPEVKLPLISAAACFGGASVFAQCMSFLAPLGVRPLEYAAGKLIQSALAASLTWLQLALMEQNTDPSFLCLLLLTVLLSALWADAALKRRSRLEDASAAARKLS